MPLSSENKTEILLIPLIYQLQIYYKIKRIEKGIESLIENNENNNSYLFSDLRFKIDPLIRILGEKIWARKILENDYQLPFYMQTYQNTEHMKFFAKWKKDSEENLKQKCIDQSRRNDLFFEQKSTLLLMFLDHQMNFFRFGIFVEKFSEILNLLNENDKKKFSEQFNRKIQNFDEKKDLLLEIGFISSINNVKKGFGDRVLKLFLKNIDQIIELFRENIELTNNEKNIIFATYHPENLPSKNLLLNNGFEKITEESFYIENYNAPRNFVCKKI